MKNYCKLLPKEIEKLIPNKKPLTDICFEFSKHKKQCVILKDVFYLVYLYLFVTTLFPIFHLNSYSILIKRLI